jgi:hypothetical protein
VLNGKLRSDGMQRQLSKNPVGRELGGGISRLDHRAVPPSRKAATVWRRKNAGLKHFMYS